MRRCSRILITALLVAAPARVYATIPCECDHGWESPSSGSTNVPTNGRVFFFQRGLDRAKLTFTKKGAMTSAVPFHIEESGASLDAFFVVPDAALEANTSYEVNTGDSSTSFETGAGEDTKPPSFKSARIIGEPLEGACDRNLAAKLLVQAPTDDFNPGAHNFDPDTDDFNPGADLLYKVELASAARTLFLSSDHPFLGRMLTDDPQWKDCLANVPEADEDGRTHQAKITALDWAGNASKPVSSDFQFVAGHGGCACSSAAGGDPGNPSALAVSLFGLAVLGWRRKRRQELELP